MKRIVLFAMAVFLAAMNRNAQYLETTRKGVGVYSSSCSYDPGTFTSYPTFDVAKITSDTFLDIAIVQNVQGCSVGGMWYGIQRNNNGTGEWWSGPDFTQKAQEEAIRKKWQTRYLGNYVQVLNTWTLPYHV